MNLKDTLKQIHTLFSENSIDHALIGGLGLACYGSTRATMDLDVLVHGNNRDQVKELLTQSAFDLVNESKEVLQFSGSGYVDILLARRPFTQEMLKKAHQDGPEGIRFVRIEDLIGLKIQAYKNDKTREFQDKADIQYLIKVGKNLNWNLIKKYADLFGEWRAIDEIKKKLEA